MMLSWSTGILIRMYAPHVAAAQPAAAARHGGRRPPWGGAPVPRLALVRVSLVAASAGLGVAIAVTITAETLGKLTAPGGLATFAGLVGTSLTACTAT